MMAGSKSGVQAEQDYKSRGENYVRERKKIVEKLKDAIPNMSEFDKGYILGKTESFSEKKDDSDQKQKES